jgi:GH24 family phage-related lysozyme (muramidase)
VLPGARLIPLERMLSDLLHFEGDVHHMYLDTNKLVTVGIGNLVDLAAARKLPFMDRRTGEPATPDQIADAFHAVARQRPGLRAESYAEASVLRLPENTVRGLVATRLENEFLPGLRRTFPGFDGYPHSAQRALVDMEYSLGVGGLAKFHNLQGACEAGDWQAAANECHRRGARAERNEWTRDLFLKAAASPPTS